MLAGSGINAGAYKRIGTTYYFCCIQTFLMVPQPPKKENKVWEIIKSIITGFVMFALLGGLLFAIIQIIFVFNNWNK